MRKRLSYANVMSSIAVFLVLGGAAVAATQLPKNSVGSKQLKKNAVTSVKVKNGSLQQADFAPGTLLQGPKGEPGKKGAKGATGATGPAGQDAPEPPELPEPPEESSTSAYGLLSVWGDPEVSPLSRSHNAKLVMLEDTPGVWCIEPQGIDPEKMVVLVSVAEESHFSAEEPVIPKVQWNVDHVWCGPKEAEIETGFFDADSGQYERSASVPFTFLIQETP
jgi:hypothetical protein